ncbi:MAG TPA: DUF2179 domain-containing protein [Longimicrobiales bacterium]|nr:DUF2179 domain-containing protein [Longimicrobiales bacterium]
METLELIFAGPWGPVVIFCLRIVDVSMATLRVLLSMRNQKAWVPIIGFVEVLVWLFAAGNAIRFLDSPWHVVGYAAGFSTGNLVGLWVEEKLALGLATVRIISAHGGVELADALRERGFGVTEFAGQGREGSVEVVYTVARRAQIPRILREVDFWDPEAFVTVEEPRAIQRGWMERTRRRRK